MVGGREVSIDSGQRLTGLVLSEPLPQTHRCLRAPCGSEHIDLVFVAGIVVARDVELLAEGRSNRCSWPGSRRRCDFRGFRLAADARIPL